jgi:cytochrome c oxidase subunit 4
MSEQHDNGHALVHHVEAPPVHVLPLWLYFGVLGILFLLTGITVLTAQYDLGPFNVPLAMLIACTKAGLVLAVFMHLWFDHKLNLVVMLSALLFFSIFVVLTIIDTESRESPIGFNQNFVPRDEWVNAKREQDPNFNPRPGEPLDFTPKGRENYNKFQAEHAGEHGHDAHGHSDVVHGSEKHPVAAGAH